MPGTYSLSSNDDGLTIFDIERGILTGKVIERQKDRITADWKYLVKDQTIAGREVVVVAKLGPTGKLVIITVYLVQEGKERIDDM